MTRVVDSRYEIDRVLARGATAIVFSARDCSRGERVALKLPKEGAGESARARLRLEAEALRQVCHPNVVQLRDAGELAGSPFLALELIEGDTLRGWLARSPRCWREVVTTFLPAGRGLAAVHASGMLHGDFKPENVMIDARGDAHLIDFGAASAVPACDELVGTAAYMAPERFTGGRIDERSDQFSFCASLYEALHGVRPFQGRTLEALAFSVTAGEISAPPRRSPRVPDDVQRLVLRGLARSPGDRYASMRALLLALRRALSPSSAVSSAIRSTASTWRL